VIVLKSSLPNSKRSSILSHLAPGLSSFRAYKSPSAAIIVRIGKSLNRPSILCALACPSHRSLRLVRSAADL
jgi:hypothetical protein